MRIVTLDEHLTVFVQWKRLNTVKCSDNGARAKYMSCYFCYFGVSYLFEEFLNHMKNSIIIVWVSDEVSSLLNYVLCIFHGDTETGNLYHRNVIETVTTAYHFFTRNTDGVKQFDKGMCFIDILRHYF